jgi:tetratricopeptide (TPR) repeat protein
MTFDVRRLHEKADEALRRRNFDGAIALLHQCLELDPGHADSRRTLRRAVAAKGGGRVSMLDRAAGTAAFALAKAHASRRDFVKAAESAQKCLVSDPTHRGAAFLLGESLEAAGHRLASVAVFEGVVEANDGDVDAWKRLGSLHRASGKIDRAIECFEKALAASPHDADALRARKDLAAEGALRIGYETAKSSRELLKDQGATHALERAERLVRDERDAVDEAASLRREIAARPEDRALRVRLAGILEARGELAAAEAELTAALAAEPSSFETRARLGDLRVRRARERSSATPEGEERERLERAALLLEVEEAAWRARERPTDMAARFEHGRALLRAGRADEGIAELQKVSRDPQRSLDALCLLGEAFVGKGLHDLASSQLEKALERVGEDSPRALEIRYQLGRIAEADGRTERALGHFLWVYERDILFRDVSRRVDALRGSGAR